MVFMIKLKRSPFRQRKETVLKNFFYAHGSKQTEFDILLESLIHSFTFECRTIWLISKWKAHREYTQQQQQQQILTIIP